MHDSSKVLLGATGSSSKESSLYDTDPADAPAGVAVSLDSDGLLDVAVSAGKRIGISLGKDLQHIDKTQVARVGLRVPVLLTETLASLTVGDLTFTSKVAGEAGNEITITLDDQVSAGSEVSAVSNDTDIVVDIEDGESTAAQIKAAIEADPDSHALVTVTIADGQAAEKQDAAAEDALEGGIAGDDYIVIGAKVYIDDVTGKANASDASAVTVSDAVYVSARLDGIAEDGSEVGVALVDMPGGL